MDSRDSNLVLTGVNGAASVWGGSALCRLHAGDVISPRHKEHLMTRRTLLMLTVMGLLIAGSGPAFAHEGHEHKVMGTVTMVAADHVMLDDTNKKSVMVYLKPDTKVVHGKMAMKVTDIKKDMRIVVTAVTEKVKGKDRLFATSIEMGASKPAK